MSPSIEEYQARLNDLKNEINELKKEKVKCEIGLSQEEKRNQDSNLIAALNNRITSVNHAITELRKEKNRLLEADAKASSLQGNSFTISCIYMLPLRFFLL
jgi:chromosome segregation ATPase